MNKDNYMECRKILKSFIKKEYFSIFSSSDIFYIMNNNQTALFTFIEQFLGDSFGCQLFFNRQGLNYVHDILTINAENVLTLCDCDTILCLFVNKNELTEEQSKYLKDNNIRILESNNLIIYRYQVGYGQRFANNSEIKIILRYLEFLHSIIQNELEDLKEEFKNLNSAICIMDIANYQYSIIYKPIPYLETFPKKTRANLELVDEFKNCTYLNDECYLFSSYIPAPTKIKNIRPLVFYAYFPKLNKHVFKYIIDEPKEYKNCMLTILYEILTSVGVPYKIIVNNRDVFSNLYNTVNKLNVEINFLREYEIADENLNNFITLIYEKTDVNPIDEVEYISILNECISNISVFMQEELEDYTIENELEFVS